jgi:hypothetical protein
MAIVRAIVNQDDAQTIVFIDLYIFGDILKRQLESFCNVFDHI